MNTTLTNKASPTTVKTSVTCHEISDLLKEKGINVNYDGISLKIPLPGSNQSIVITTSTDPYKVGMLEFAIEENQ